MACIPDDLIPNILQRLPAAAVLRFRAVCKQWRALVDDPSFATTHHRHRPAMRLLCVRDDDPLDPADHPTSPRQFRVRLEAIDARARATQPEPVFRFAVPAAVLPGYAVRKGFRDKGTFLVHGSCDGVLLASYNSHVFLCNPATRRWRSLPIGGSGVVGFYPHRPSGEFRVLTGDASGSGTDIYFDHWVVTFDRGCPVESRLPMGREHDSDNGRLLAACRVPRASKAPPALVAGSLHWLLEQPPGGSVVGRELLVFDTVAETFRRMRPPPPAVDAAADGHQEDQQARLLELDGKLTMTVVITRSGQPLAAQLWVLQEYERDDSWACKLQVPLPAHDIVRLGGGHRPGGAVSIVSLEGDVNVMVECAQCLLHCDAMGRVLQAHHHTIAVPHMFRESLVPHHSVNSREISMGYGVPYPPFFVGTNPELIVAMRSAKLFRRIILV